MNKVKINDNNIQLFGGGLRGRIDIEIIHKKYENNPFLQVDFTLHNCIVWF